MQSASLSQTPVSAVKSSGKLHKSYTDAYLAAMSNLNTRYYKTLYVLSIAFAVLFQAKFTLDYHTILGIVSWRTFFFSLSIFSAGATISFVRNMTYTVFEPTYPSYLAQSIATWTSLDNVPLLVIHSFFSLLIVRFYFSWMMDEKYTSEFLLQPPGHYLGARQLNQENIFITAYAVILAINYTCDYISKRTNVVKVGHAQQPCLYQIKTSLATLFCNSAMRAIYSFRNAYIVYIACNSTIYYYVAHFFGFYYKVLDSPIVGFRWVDPHLFLRLIIAGTVTACAFNIANRVYDIVYSSKLLAAEKCVSPYNCLINGLSDEKINAKLTAFSELAWISTKMPEKRAEIFLCVGKSLEENAWFKIMRQCLEVIRELKTNIHTEYNGVQQVTTPAPVVKPVENQQIRNRVVISEANVLANQHRYVDGLEDRTNTLFSDVSEKFEGVPSPLPIIQQSALQTWTNAQQSQLVKMIKQVELQVGYAGLLRAWYAESVTRKVQAVFTKYQLIIWAVQALGSLTAASLKEDPYGYAQNDLSSVTNELLECLIDVENYLANPPATYSQLLKEDDVVVGEAEAVVLALRDAIYQIRVSFDDYLYSFNILGKNSKKWERFLSYYE